MTLRSMLTLLSTSFIITTFAQRPTDKTVKVASWKYPLIAATQPVGYQVLIHNGTIPVETSALVKKKGLMAGLQKSQDEINGRIVDYFTYYSYTPTASNPDLLIEVSFSTYTTRSTALKEHKIPCTIEGQKITKETLRECPAYYYERNYTLPYILRITDKSGKILHTEHFSGEGSQTFGYDATGLTGYLRKVELDSAFQSQQKRQPLQLASQAMVSQLNAVEPVIQALCFYTPANQKLSIASAAGKDFDYAALNSAQAQAINAFAKWKPGNSSEFLAAVSPAIATWRQELGTLNMSQDDARINRRIATGLYTNLAVVYAYTWQLDSAEAYIAKAQNLVKYAASLNAQEDIQSLAADIRDQRAKMSAYQAQIAQTVEPVKAPVLIDAIRVKAKDMPYAAITGKNYYDQWTTSSVTPTTDATFAKALDSVLKQKTGGSGDNPFESRVQKTSFQGYTLLLTAFGDGKFETLPEEICKIHYLNELTVTNNSLKALPESISQLTELRKLNLSNNRLTSLPVALQQCKKLKMLNLKGNAIPPAEIQALQQALPECKIKS